MAGGKRQKVGEPCDFSADAVADMSTRLSKTLSKNRAIKNVDLDHDKVHSAVQSIFGESEIWCATSHVGSKSLALAEQVGGSFSTFVEAAREVRGGRGAKGTARVERREGGSSGCCLCFHFMRSLKTVIFV